MSSALNITRPIVGLAANQFIPLTDINFVIICIWMCIECATLFFWAVILVAIVRDRHYEDPNNLLIVSFALSDIVFASTSFHNTLSLVMDHGYSRGFIGKIIDYQEMYQINISHLINIYLFHRLCLGVILSDCRVLRFRNVCRRDRSRQISAHVSWILCQLVKDLRTTLNMLVYRIGVSRSSHFSYPTQ